MAIEPILARQAAQIAPRYITEIAGREPEQLTAVEPTDDGGWLVEVEIVEDRRVPSSADMLALYEIELDADGELLGYSRTRRYMRTEGLGFERTTDGDGVGSEWN
ncbi:MAG TPA: gas vesicle protein GvpO [Mycobacterium sp.]|nr:gas vesicle protein GvpO [Mycobacterium sp.]